MDMYNAMYNLSSPYTAGYLDYYDGSTTADYETNQTTIYSRSNKMDTLKIVTIALFSIIFILGIIGNGLVIWIAGFRMKKTISAVWFLHLAIADLLCCAFLLLYIVGWSSGDVCLSPLSLVIFCFIDINLLNFTMSASVLFLTAMSIERWVSVMWPFWGQVHRTHKVVRITAGIIWAMSFLWTGIMTHLVMNCLYNTTCKWDTLKNLNVTNLVITFLIPFLIIFTSYVTIFIKLRKINKPEKFQRPYRIITTVILCFFISWSPFKIYPLTPICLRFDIQNLIVDAIIPGLACLNSCINPIIYVFMGQDIRPGFLRSILLRVESALSDHPDDPSKEQENLQPAPSIDM